MGKLTHLGAEDVKRRIHLIRGQRVILDADLAFFYGVATGELNRAVLRNRERFPPDFAFILTREEVANLKCQTGISSLSHGGSRREPTVFTEQGVAMVATVLRSRRAVKVSVALIRAFVQLRELLSTHRDLAAKLAELEKKLEGHDAAIGNLFEAIRQLLAPPDPPPGRKIGFNRG
jgi:hypothetical protein